MSPENEAECERVFSSEPGNIHAQINLNTVVVSLDAHHPGKFLFYSLLWVNASF